MSPTNIRNTRNTIRKKKSQKTNMLSIIVQASYFMNIFNPKGVKNLSVHPKDDFLLFKI